jgi:hypothetical protein
MGSNCKGCQFRFIGCHTGCVVYQEYAKVNHELKHREHLRNLSVTAKKNSGDEYVKGSILSTHKYTK